MKDNKLYKIDNIESLIDFKHSIDALKYQRRQYKNGLRNDIEFMIIVFAGFVIFYGTFLLSLLAVFDATFYPSKKVEIVVSMIILLCLATITLRLVIPVIKKTVLIITIKPEKIYQVLVERGIVSNGVVLDILYPASIIELKGKILRIRYEINKEFNEEDLLCDRSTVVKQGDTVAIKFVKVSEHLLYMILL